MSVIDNNQGTSPAGASNPEQVPQSQGSQQGEAQSNGASNGATTPEHVPYNRFQEVIAERNKFKSDVAELKSQFETLRQSTLSEEQRKEEELEGLRKKAHEYDSLNERYQQSENWINNQAKAWVAGLTDERRNTLLNYARVKGIDTEDHRALYKEGTALDASGLLGNSNQTTTTQARPAPPTHAGTPANNQDTGLPAGMKPGSKEHMRYILRQNFNRR